MESSYRQISLKKQFTDPYMEYANELQVSVAQYFLAETEIEFSRAEKDTVEKLFFVNEYIKSIRRTSGEQLDLLDCCYAPLFKLIDSLQGIYTVKLLPGFEPIMEWGLSLLKNKSVMSSLPIDYEKKLNEFICTKASYLSNLSYR